MENSNFTFVDIFGAPGGMSLGFEMAGFRPVAVIDNDHHGTETYRRNFPNAEVCEADVKSNKVGKMISKLSGVDVIVGGPPCEGFSLVGRIKIASLVREGKWNLSNSDQKFVDDPRNELYKEFIAIVKKLEPKIFVMENVPGMLSYRNGEIVSEIINNFQRIGYKTDPLTLKSEFYGVPQARKRLFFMGNRLGTEIRPPEQTHEYTRKTNGLGLLKVVKVREAIGDLPTIRQGRGSEKMAYTKKCSVAYQEWARKGSSWVYNHVARHHTERDIRMFKVLKPGKKWEDLPQDTKSEYGYRDDAFLDKFKKLPENRPSWTVQSHLCKDGYDLIHPTQLRTITVREAARLQSFPDNFIFCGPRTHQFHQVGRAVPPLLARAIAFRVKEMLQSSSSSSR